MVQAAVKQLDSGDIFPKMDFKLADGTSLMLPVKDDGLWRAYFDDQKN